VTALSAREAPGRTWLGLAAGFGLLALGACASQDTPATPAPAPEIAARSPEAPSPPSREEPAPEAAHLIGLKADDVTALLGAPGLRRRDAPAEIWQYGDAACTLDLFLYTDKAGRAPYTVTHVEVRRRPPEAISKDDCLRRVLKARRAQRTG
jgi:hypothetical protein